MVAIPLHEIGRRGDDREGGIEREVVLLEVLLLRIMRVMLERCRRRGYHLLLLVVVVMVVRMPANGGRSPI